MTRDELFAALEGEVKNLGADHAAVIDASEIALDARFRTMCEANSCGVYGKCWMCPPDAGEIGALMQRVRTYRHALVFQQISPLEDSFDIEGMWEAKEKHHRLCQSVRTACVEMGTEHPLLLGAGKCGICKSCAKLDEKPCRFPHLAYSSLEAHGIDVTKLAASAAMKYTNGANTVTYFGVVLFGEA
ncbi:MAG: DUF2284 domain-containing protein [Clostridia bacterium]|nr:DUF2284 domain-containing protein [Clostridia bacterium]